MKSNNSLASQLTEWKRDLTELGQEKARKEGALQEAMSQLEKEGFKTVDEANEYVAKQQEDLEEVLEKAKAYLQELGEKYAKFIE